MLLEELEDILEIDIDDVEVDSVGGWLYAQLGTEPRIGQMAAYRGHIFYVEEVDGVLRPLRMRERIRALGPTIAYAAGYAGLTATA